MCSDSPMLSHMEEGADPERKPKQSDPRSRALHHDAVLPAYDLIDDTQGLRMVKQGRLGFSHI